MSKPNFLFLNPLKYQRFFKSPQIYWSFGVAAGLWVTYAVGTVAQSPSVPALPQPIPAAATPVMSGIIDLADADKPLGVGYLLPAETNQREANDGVGWLREMTLPLYSAPNGSHWGWFVRGWLVPNDQPGLVIGRDAAFTMVRVGNRAMGFPVLEILPDGWMRMQYTPGGSAWIHRDQLSFGDLDLTVETWRDQITDAKQVQFRNADAAQVLRSQPELNRNVISLVSANSLIEPLSITGNWMRVRVTRPADGCQPLGGASTEEGWMQWRNDQGEILLWEDPNACS